MNQDKEKALQDLNVSDEVFEYIENLLSKSVVVNEKTEKHKNCVLSVGDLSCNIRVDDDALLYLGVALLPNMVNYLVNILPQFLYPYVVAYLQDLSTLRDDPFTITELSDIVKSLKVSE